MPENSFSAINNSFDLRWAGYKRSVGSRAKCLSHPRLSFRSSENSITSKMALKTLFFLSSLLAFLSSVNALIIKPGICPTGQLTLNTQCCGFFALAKDLQNSLFHNECNTDAREALRLAFHDAMGKADGSIITFASTELAYEANDDTGVSDIVEALTPFVAKYDVSPGDLIFLAAAVGLANCKGAPRIEFFAGRAPPAGPAPDGTVPLPTGKSIASSTQSILTRTFPIDSVTTIIGKYAAAGFSTQDIVTSLASHSVAAGDALGGAPFDSSPEAFDAQFFVETQLDDVIPGEARLPSDAALARDSRTACAWQEFVTDQFGMRAKFANFMARLQVVGIDRNKLTDCSEVVPCMYRAIFCKTES